jgi:phage terminase large subunit
MELKFALQPKQRLFRETVAKTPVTFYGGAKGGGKSRGVRDIMLLRRLENPKTHGGLFRRTYKELEGNHIRPLFKEHPELRQFWNDSKKVLNIPNGSSLEFCHCESESDVELYQGREFEDLAIEEAGQWTEKMFRTLHGSNRSSTPGFTPRCLLTGNPGGIGHAWLKRLFIERRFNERERPQDYAFIKALVDDNPALLKNDPDYVHRLEAEPNEALRKAYRYGDWDIFAGQFFTELRREVHFVRPFDIPDHWTRFGAYDFGFNHPAAFGWFACDEDGNVYLYREFVKAQLRVDQFAAAINRFPETKQLNPIVAGWDAWAKKAVLRRGAPPTVAEEFLAHELILSRAQIDRIQGAAQLRSYLAWQDKAPIGGGKAQDGLPRLFIFSTCPITFEALSRMQHDPDRPEDVLKIDATDGDPMSGDDAYDMIRMGMMSRPILAERQKIRLRAGSPELVEHTRKLMDDQLQRDIDRQEAEDKERQSFETFGMDSGEVASYFIQKKRGK